jgi:hypothetical protein
MFARCLDKCFCKHKLCLDSNEEGTMQINHRQLQKIVDEALNKCGTNRRWSNAVRRAERELLENPYIHFDGQTLLVELALAS